MIRRPCVMLPWCVGLAFVAACSGGDGPAVRAEPNNDVPNASDPAPAAGQPPRAEPAPNATDPAPGAEQPGANETTCTRICSALVRLDCAIDDDVRTDCAGACASLLREEICGTQLASLLDCVLQSGVCPEDLDDVDPNREPPVRCIGAIEAYDACEPDNPPADDGQAP